MYITKHSFFFSCVYFTIFACILYKLLAGLSLSHLARLGGVSDSKKKNKGDKCSSVPLMWICSRFSHSYPTK